jgi:hypothetical protein
VVIGYRLGPVTQLDLPHEDDQHSAFRWIGDGDADDETVHENARVYLDVLRG